MVGFCTRLEVNRLVRRARKLSSVIEDCPLEHLFRMLIVSWYLAANGQVRPSCEQETHDIYSKIVTLSRSVKEWGLSSDTMRVDGGTRVDICSCFK